MDGQHSLGWHFFSAGMAVINRGVVCDDTWAAWRQFLYFWITGYHWIPVYPQVDSPWHALAMVLFWEVVKSLGVKLAETSHQP